MKSNLLLILLTLGVLVVALHFVEMAANSGTRVTPDAPETLSDERQFDFWLGDWELTWGKEEKGTNTVRSILGGHIVQENFVATSGNQAGFTGMSVSAYNKEHGTWLQTWVDNQGGYLDFVGQYKDNKMTLSRKALKDGKEFLQRMVWQDISRDSLNWFWERSDNDGKTWTTVWKVHYQRKGFVE
jgi:hypothetical protein